MKRFTPYVKLSKQKKKELDKKKRGSWRGLNPITRVPPNPKAYDRKKARKRSQDDDFSSAPFYCSCFSYGSGLGCFSSFFFCLNFAKKLVNSPAHSSAINPPITSGR